MRVTGMRNLEGAFELADASAHFCDLVVKSVGVCKDETRSVWVKPKNKKVEDMGVPGALSCYEASCRL